MKGSFCDVFVLSIYIPNHELSERTSLSLSRALHRLSLAGPKDSLYEDKAIALRMYFTRDYPFEPPEVIFLDDLVHPNMQKGGHHKYPDAWMCYRTLLGIEHHDWSPARSPSDILRRVMTILKKPNLQAPINVRTRHIHIYVRLDRSPRSHSIRSTSFGRWKRHVIGAHLTTI